MLLAHMGIFNKINTGVCRVSLRVFDYNVSKNDLNSMVMELTFKFLL